MTAGHWGVVVVSVAWGLLAAFVCLLVHELGHLFVGLAVGFRFQLLVVGPLQIWRDPGEPIRFGWNRDLALYGGAAGTTPTLRGDVRGRFAALVAAGPIANLLLAIAAALALPHVAPGHHVLRVELQWIRLISGVLFAINAVPMANGPFVTDGLRLLRILGSGPHAKRERAMLILTALESAGARPREWDDALLSDGLSVRDGGMFECAFHLWAYMQALDRGQIARAGEALDRALALSLRSPGPQRAQCQLEAAWFEAVHRGLPDEARRAFAQVPAHVLGITECDRLRARAALAVASGTREEAVAAIEHALSAAGPLRAAQAEWLRALKGRTGPA